MKTPENIVQCRECKRTRNGQSWSDARPQPFSRMSHTYCPGCIKNAMQKLMKQVSTHSLGHLSAL